MRPLGVVLVVALAVTACQGGADEVRGVVVSIEGQLARVTGFELVTDDGARFIFRVDPDGEFDGLPLSHLNEHRLSAEPISVSYEDRDGLVAIAIEDG